MARLLMAVLILSAGYASAQFRQDFFGGFGVLRGEQGDPAELPPEGATIVTHESNKDFCERVVLAPQPRSLSPDRLAHFPFATTGPGPQRLETFAERHAISDGTQTLISYHLEGLNHVGDMAIVYLAAAKLLVSADMGPPAAGTPPANVSPNSVALYNNIRRLKLDVGQHVPIHGNPSSHADFERAVGPAAAHQQAGATGG